MLVDQRADLGLGVHRIADPQVRDFLKQSCHEGVINLPVHKDVLNRDAALPGQHEGIARAGDGSGLGIGIRMHDGRADSAQLKRDTLHASVLANDPADVGRACEADEIDPFVRDHDRPNRVAIKRAERTLRQSARIDETVHRL